MRLYPKILVVSFLIFSLSSCSTLEKTIAEYSPEAAQWMNEHRKELKIAAGVAVTVYIAYNVYKHLNEEEQKQMEQATGETIASGDTRTWKNKETGTQGQARVVSEKNKEDEIKIKVLKDKVEKVPPLEIIGSSYEVSKKANVRGGPSKDYRVISSLPQNTIVNVVGKVKDSDWYLVSQDGVGSGFVYAQLLKEAPNKNPTASEQKIAKENTSEKAVSASRICRKIEQSITLENGSSHKDEIEACKGVDGWEAQAS